MESLQMFTPGDARGLAGDDALDLGLELVRLGARRPIAGSSSATDAPDATFGLP